LTHDAARKHFPDLDKTHKGYRRKTNSSLHSTKTISLLDNSDKALDPDHQYQTPPRPIKKDNNIFFCVHDMEDQAMQKIWTDQPGRFLKKSSKGNQYIMVLTESKSDTILVKPMKNCTSGELIRAYQALID
jgi:hypothetical protein